MVKIYINTLKPFWSKRKLALFAFFIKKLSKLVFPWPNMSQKSFKVLKTKIKRNLNYELCMYGILIQLTGSVYLLIVKWLMINKYNI